MLSLSFQGTEKPDKFWPRRRQNETLSHRSQDFCVEVFDRQISCSRAAGGFCWMAPIAHRAKQGCPHRIGRFQLGAIFSAVA